MSSSPIARDGTAGTIKRVVGGVMISGSMRGIRMGLVKESNDLLRVTSVGGTTLGKGETVFLEPGLVEKGKDDANFQILADDEFVDLIIEVDDEGAAQEDKGYGYEFQNHGLTGNNIPLADKSTLSELLSKLGFDVQISDLLALVGGDSTSPAAERQNTPGAPATDATTTALNTPQAPKKKHKIIPAVMATGIHVFLPPDAPFSSSPSTNPPQLAFSAIHFSDTACSPDTTLPTSAQIIFVRRGGCTFLQKIRNVPDTRTAKLLVIVDTEEENDGELVRPLLNEKVDRKWGLPVVMLAGKGDGAKAVREGKVGAVGVRWRWKVLVKGEVVGNLVVL